MVRSIRKLKLEFPSLNGLLHCILTYLRGEIAVVPGAASIPEGTSIELNLTYPDADEPVVVRGVSQGLDPAGRGLRLKLDNPQDVDQVTMLLGHLHLGPYAARKLMAFVRLQQESKPRLLGQPSVAAPSPQAPQAEAAAAGTKSRSTHLGRAPRSIPSKGDQQLLDKASEGFRSAQRRSPVPRVQPPRARPPSGAQTRISMPTRRTEIPGRAGASSRTELPKPRPAGAPPSTQRSGPPKAPRRRRPPISSDRMPGLPKAPPRPAKPIAPPAQVVPATPRPPAAPVSPGPPVAPAGHENELDQTQMVRLDDLKADLGSSDDY